MSNITYNHNEPIYESELHVVIKSLQKSKGDTNANSVQQFTSNLMYYIVSVNTIYNQAFVVPDIGNDVNTVLYVYQHDNWKKIYKSMSYTKFLFLFHAHYIYQYKYIKDICYLRIH